MISASRRGGIFYVALISTVLIFVLNLKALALTRAIETIDDGSSFSLYPRSLALDKDSRPHITYGGDHLYYSFYNGNKWIYETVDESLGAGEGASIAIDQADNAYICYQDSLNRKFKYATNRTGSWVIETIFHSPNRGYSGTSSIAIDSSGHAHVALIVFKCLRYANNASGTWKTYEICIDNAFFLEDSISLAVDSSGHAHMSGYDYYHHRLTYVTNSSGTWKGFDIDPDIGKAESIRSGWKTSLAVDSNDHIHISYPDAPNRRLKYITNASGKWVSQVVNSSSAGYEISLALGSSGDVHITYTDTCYGPLRYAVKGSDSWSISTLGGIGGVHSPTSIAIDPCAKVHVMCSSGSRIEYVTNLSGSWNVEKIDDYDDRVGTYNSIAIDSLYNVHISYCNRSLHYATNKTGSWEVKKIDSKGASHTSLALDSSDCAHISFFSGGKLKYATDACRSWKVYTLDPDISGESGTSVAVDRSGSPHISYYDQTKGDLKYATRDSSGKWIIKAIDTGNVGKYSSIAIDSANNVHIGYYGKDKKELKYATNLSGDWETRIIDPNILAAYESKTSINLDSSGHIHICYEDMSNGDPTFTGGLLSYPTLKHATNISGSWTIEKLGESPQSPSSLDIDSSGKIYISTNCLEYITNASGFWETRKMDTDKYLGMPGDNSSIVVDSRNYIHISYFNNGLKYYIAVPAIEPLVLNLKNANETIRVTAVRTLGDIKDIQAVEPLISILNDKSANVRKQAAGALGKIKDPRAVEPLIRCLQDGDSSVRIQVIQSLGALRNLRAGEALADCLDDADYLIRRHAAIALQEIAAIASQEIKDQRIIGSLIAALSDKDWSVCEYSASALEKIGKPAVKPLIALLKGENQQISKRAESVLTNIGTPAVQSLLTGLEDDDAKIRVRIIKILGEIKDRNSIVSLIMALNDEDKALQKEAVVALGKIGCPAVELLVSALNDNNPDIQKNAALALGHIRDPRHRSPLGQIAQ